MLLPALSLDQFIEELNGRLRLHPNYREGMLVVRDPLAVDTGGPAGYTFTWPKGEGDETQAWFDARYALCDIELEMREQYQLAAPEAAASSTDAPPALASGAVVAAGLSPAMPAALPG